MYAPFFGLNDKPFSITPDPRYLFLSERHAEALAHLVYGINEAGGFIQLTGEVGTGKTTVVRSLLAQAPKHAEIALILNPRMTAPEFLLAICEELGIQVAAESERSVKDLVDLLSQHLLKAHAAGRRIVLVVDEAQNLAPEVLEQVRLLTNLETETQKLLQIILIGQPELRELLGRTELRQLAQRITGRYHLAPLAANESAAYVRHRLRVAGATREIFATSSLREVQRLSGGVPRLINIICDRALLGAFTEDRHVVTASVVRRAAGEVFGRTLQPGWLPWAAGSTLAAAVIAAGVIFWPRAFAPQLPAATNTAVAASTPAPSAPALPAPTLDKLLSEYGAETDPDNAFNKLFALWGLRYVAGSTDPCSQAMQAGLECLTQRGSLAQLRLFNRPAVLNVIDTAGRGHQLVLAGLEGERAHVDLGGAQREVGIGDLASSWFGDYVLLWRPAAGGSQPLALGGRGARVRWLRDSLRKVNGLPQDATGGDRFDPALATLVEEFQRKHRLAVDGIAGVQTQVALDAALKDSATPFLHGAGAGAEMSFILDALKKSEMDRQRQATPALFEVKVAAPRRDLPLVAISLGGLLVLTVGILVWVLLRAAPSAPAVGAATNGAVYSTAQPGAAPPGMVTVPATVTIPTTVQIPASAAPTITLGNANQPGVVGPSAAPPLAQESTAEPLLSNNDPAVPPDYNANDYVTAVTPAEARAAAAQRSSSLPSRDEILAQGQALPDLRLDLHVFASNRAERFVFINMRKLREGDVTPEGVRVEAIVESGAELSYRGKRFFLERS